MKQSHTDSFSPPGETTYTIAIDMGGTNIKIGLMREGRLIERRVIVAQSASGLKSKLPELEKEIDQLLHTNEIEKKEVLGIGFSFASRVDSIENRLLSTNQKYDDAPEIDMVAWSGKNWNWPLFAMNDARMALLGEWQQGVGQGCANLAMVILGTGIGSAVMIDGELLIGKHFQSGNPGGHFVVNH